MLFPNLPKSIIVRMILLGFDWLYPCAIRDLSFTVVTDSFDLLRSSTVSGILFEFGCLEWIWKGLGMRDLPSIILSDSWDLVKSVMVERLLLFFNWLYLWATRDLFFPVFDESWYPSS